MRQLSSVFVFVDNVHRTYVLINVFLSNIGNWVLLAVLGTEGKRIQYAVQMSAGKLIIRILSGRHENLSTTLFLIWIKTYRSRYEASM